MYRAALASIDFVTVRGKVSFAPAESPQEKGPYTGSVLSIKLPFLIY